MPSADQENYLLQSFTLGEGVDGVGGSHDPTYSTVNRQLYKLCYRS